MNHAFRLYAAVTLAALIVAGSTVSCSKIDPITAPKAGSGRADFSRYAAMGTSIGAGYQSGGLVYRHQEHAYPALFARRAGSAFTYPAISDSGLPALLRLVSLNGPVILPGSHPGLPTNLTWDAAYTNMSVPGALLADVADSSLYGRSQIFAIIQRGRGTILQQVASLNPTFVSFEFGVNEVLGPAISGSGTPVVDWMTFRGLLHATLDSVQAYLPNAKLALFNVPDVTSIPFVTTIKPYLVNPANGSHIPLIGPDGLLAENDFVLLTAAPLLAAGTGIPIPLGGNGNPLPDAVVLSADEADDLRYQLDSYNADIEQEAGFRGMALVDLHGLLLRAATTGIQVGGARYSSAFLTGGLFSLDGVHPTDLGQGLIANTMIDAVNEWFSASIPHLNLSDLATATSSRVRRTHEDGAAAWPRVEGLAEALQALFPRR